MTNFYRFPELKGLETFSMEDQIQKMREEIEELSNAYYSVHEDILFGVELMDVIHSVETAIRQTFTDDEVEMLYNLVIAKNKKRDYYE